MKGPLNRGGAYIKGRTIRKVMGGGGFLRGNIFFLYTYRRNIFFFSLDGWKFFFK